MPLHDNDELVVKYGALDATATTIGNQAKEVERLMGEIKSAAAQVAAGWDGEAHTAYTNLQNVWTKEARDIHTALTQIGHVVHQAGGDYMGGDKKAASFFQ